VALAKLPVALGGGVHVVPDANGLSEQAFHAAEVDAAVHEVLHGAGKEGQADYTPARVVDPTLWLQRSPAWPSAPS
jgi:hypothetical protein